ncbi:MAG: hypothetical protein JWL69_4901 [Phycisphaerales bacterium]|nr:hypothetical protein [Phycisphaerales bacterium]MDB5358365.1 hypothetical protein [Phycisphaerales bacterium]
MLENTHLESRDLLTPLRGWVLFFAASHGLRRGLRSFAPPGLGCRLVLFCSVALLVGCSAPSGRIDFPAKPLERSPRGLFYDIHHTGRADFALMPDEHGKLDVLGYDHDGDGKFDRLYRLSDYANEDVPHLIVLLDSIPYQKLTEAYAAGRLAWFDPPAKVIPPFPTLTELIFTKVLGAPPLPGMIDQYYDRDKGTVQKDLWNRVIHTYREPWERRLHYDATMYQSGLAYLDPRPWLGAELLLAKEAFDRNPDRVTLVYFTSASAMLCRYGAEGFDETIDGIERMCLRILYERQGAVKITLMADHGHNLMASKNVILDQTLKDAGFNPASSLKKPNDVVMEINGLVTYAGVRTTQPVAVAAALLKRPEIHLATYLQQDRVIVRDALGTAAIECRNRRVRYRPIDRDVLGYAPVIAQLQAVGKADADGFAADDDWFAATLDHEYPDAPRRLWDAFHGTVVNPPDVMLVVRDGYCIGLPEYERFVHMASTHGGLNQRNSATFVMTMTGRVKGPMKSRDILRTIEPGYVPGVLGKRR